MPENQGLLQTTVSRRTTSALEIEIGVVRLTPLLQKKILTQSKQAKSVLSTALQMFGLLKMILLQHFAQNMSLKLVTIILILKVQPILQMKQYIV